MNLRIMSWNIHRCIGVDRRFKPERVAECIAHYSPDILCLQEVDRGVPRSRKLYLDHFLAEALGYEFHTWSQAHTLTLGAYGNATLSRFPIVKRRVLDLTVSGKKKRNSLYTRIKVKRRNLHLFNWHLGLSAGERRSQVQHLLGTNTVRDLPDNSRIILAGDTNDWRNLLFNGCGIADNGYDAWSEHGRRKLIRTFPSTQPLGALDKFFWKGAIDAERIYPGHTKQTRLASDHLPLVADFTLS
ncbi:MAG: endonuclease/exonuclease/phosphatase family metal-dependent hydrolase [Myxococcota bacterium]|jgi:endonuclease/exonuclease/phosphatase family metal-dependent hydrolase